MRKTLVGYVVIEHDPERDGPELATDDLYETALAAEGQAQEFAEVNLTIGISATYSVASVYIEVAK